MPYFKAKEAGSGVVFVKRLVQHEGASGETNSHFDELGAHILAGCSDTCEGFLSDGKPDF